MTNKLNFDRKNAPYTVCHLKGEFHGLEHFKSKYICLLVINVIALRTLLRCSH